LEVFNLFIVILLSLTFGSFLNVLIYRLPINLSLINPKRSICPSCNNIIKWYDNIPIISFVFLKGKCSNCNNKISFLYPLVELITVGITVAVYLQLGLNQDFYYITSICYCLIILSFIDFKYKAVPSSLLVLITIITLAYLLTNKIENFSDFFAFAGAIFIIDLFVTYYIQNIKANILKNDSLKSQKAIGEGDIPIIACIGGILGLQFGIVAIFISAILAIIPSVLNIILKKEIETPFIPFLSLGFIITYTNTDTIQKILEGLNIV